ncbi:MULTISPECIES: type I methionyl aminopeptidase [Methylococcus]|uniref:Methionine aminopeptidase n=1 Tax=Methylococcus capsulatus TaxID=414 RepID=A0ABZ2F7I4_METCP|nr:MULTISPECIES: type I methionyl aminopeptidase [Methylococcus]MDF9393458.1 type I methionyl aminopeptidase [Methylococcus capsulatus]
MSISIKSAEEIEGMRLACRLAAEVLDMIAPFIKAGITTEEIDRICHDFIVDEQRAIPAPLNYKGFPKSICTSVNHVVCHGIPGPKKLKNGDIVNIDITVIKDGFHGDTSKMFLVGQVKPYARQLVDVTREAMYLGIREVRPGAALNRIGAVIERHASKYNYSVVREFCGHGIGREFHEEPQVLHYFEPKLDIRLEAGMIFTIEPMINQGKRHVQMLSDGWTAVTKDHKLSAQWEHTVLVTPTGYEVLTLRQEEDFGRTELG